MAYNLDFLEPLDTLQESQPGLLENYQEIFNLVGQDHEQFNTAHAGKHKQLTFPDQNPFLIPDTSAIEYGLFNLNALSLSALFFQKSGLTATSAKNGSFCNIFSLINGQQPGFVSMRLPSGILIKWTNVPSITGGAGEAIFHWNQVDTEEHFTTQYWAAVFCNQLEVNGTEINAPTIYVTNISDPSQVRFRLWVTSSFNSPIVSYDISLQIVAIGV
jgi:hypothetical protein